MANDSELGNKVKEHLINQGIETPMTRIGATKEEIFHTIRSNHRSTMAMMGLDLTDDSLRDTPKRVAKMFCEEIFTGLNYENFPGATVVENKFQYDEVVQVSAEVKSVCEHHFMPIVGRAHIAYIPKQKVLGLSKFNRITEFFSRRPQVQERLTEQLSATLRFLLGTDDVAVVINAEHFCVKFRGVEDMNGSTTTSKLSGRFKTNDALRAEFFALTRGK